MAKPNPNNSIRLIAGQWRGRRLPVLDKPGLRPTTDRVRETVFNWLMTEVADTRCLDLFAGTGALGLECLSRGAKFVQFVERDRQVSAALQQNLDSLNAGERAQCWTGTAGDFLSSHQSTEMFGLVFLDPPFADAAVTNIAQQLDESGCLRSDALVYVETDNDQPPPLLPERWQVYRSKSAGQSRYELYSLV